jgi:hypothetical protein
MIPFVTGLATGAQIGGTILAPLLEWWGVKIGLIDHKHKKIIDRIEKVEKSVIDCVTKE